MATNAIPPWFAQVIGEGLARLRLVGFPGTPAADTVKPTATVWADAIWGARGSWDQELDQQRLREAFREAARKCDQWPVPKQVLLLMPARPQLQALPEPPITEEQRKRNLQRIRQLVSQVVKH